MIVALAGLKGGQGKSAIAARLGVMLAGLGHRVVVVDLALTGTSSLLLGVAGGEAKGSGALIAGTARMSEALRRTTLHPGLFLVPADELLLQLERMPPRDPGKTGLPGLARTHDVVLLDLPPGAGTAATIGLRAADWILLPCLPDESSIGGLGTTLRWIGTIGGRRRHLIAICQSEDRVRAAADAEAMLRAAHGRAVLRSAIRRDASWRRHDTVARVVKTRGLKGADADLRGMKRELLARIVKEN